MRIISSIQFTVDARWIVVDKWLGDFDSIIFDPSNNDDWTDLQDCIDFVITNNVKPITPTRSDA